MAYEWAKYPDSLPSQAGYYLTLYYNAQWADHMTKCIWWDGESWCAWRPGVMTSTDVKGFVPDTVNPYYAPCMIESNRTVPHVDLDLFPFLKRDSDHDPKTTPEDL